MLPYLLAFCRIAIGLLFAYGFLAKAREFSGFAQTIANFDLLPWRWTKTAALLFLGGEVVVVILLILGGRLLPLAFALAGLLLLTFTLALLSALRRGIETACNCLGASQKPLTYYGVWRNAGLGAAAAAGLWAASAAGETNAGLTLVELLFMAIMAGVFVLLWTNLDDITALFRTA